jgi:hypothetical protein
MFRKHRRWFVALALTAALAGGFAYWHHHRYKHFAVHEKGMVYRSAWVEPDVLAELIEKYQYRSVVNLCHYPEMGEQRWREEERVVTGAGARFFRAPMPFSAQADEKDIARHIEILNDPDNYPMLVHCQHGVTRTAKFLAIYDVVHRHMGADESLDAMPLFGREDHNVNVRAFARSFEKQYRKLYPQAQADALDVLRR